MACYQVNLISVEFKAKNIKFLKRALDSIGIYRVRQITDTIISYGNLTFNLKFGTVDLPEEEQPFLNRVKRAYSKEVVKEIAKKKKWMMKELDKNKMRLRRY